MMSAVPPELPAPKPVTATVAGLTDFNDRLSPMVVKELRQGTRTRTFAIAFIVLQVVLGLALLISLSAEDASAIHFLFWWVLLGVLFFVIPLRGFSALANEEKLNTMDLILMTHLTAWRITFGKWFALVSQAALIVVAMLPYAVLRYFLGGVNVFSELLWVALAFLGSCVLVAITVGFSGHRFFLVRGAIAAGAVFLGMMSFAVVNRARSLSEANPFEGMGSPLACWGVLLLVAAFAIYYLLDMGATLIAPAAENHATRKRLASLAVLGILAGAGAGAPQAREPVFLLICIIATVATFDSLTETPNLLRSVFAPFVRRGASGWLAGRFLYPGWHTGILFTLAVAAGVFAIGSKWDYIDGGVAFGAGHGAELLEVEGEAEGVGVAGHEFEREPEGRSIVEFRPTEEFLAFVGALGSLVFPLALIQIFFRRAPQVFTVYLLIQALVALSGLLIVIVVDSTRVQEIFYGGFAIPFVCFLAGIEDPQLLPHAMIGAMLVTAVCFVVLLARATPIYRRTGQIERELRRAGRGQHGQDTPAAAPPPPSSTTAAP